jgi:hypothetical protein
MSVRSRVRTVFKDAMDSRAFARRLVSSSSASRRSEACLDSVSNWWTVDSAFTSQNSPSTAVAMILEVLPSSMGVHRQTNPSKLTLGTDLPDWTVLVCVVRSARQLNKRCRHVFRSSSSNTGLAGIRI